MRAISIAKGTIGNRRNTRRLLAGSIAILLSLMPAVTGWAGGAPTAPQTTRAQRDAIPQQPATLDAIPQQPATVFTNPSPITINDAVGSSPFTPYPSTVNVSGLTGTVTNMTVTLNNINHTFVPDFDILLVAPDGSNMIIFSDVGSGIDTTNVIITLDDAAAASLTAANLVSGTFKPTNITAGDAFPAPAPAASANTTFAAAFNGIDPNGTWSLYVVDDVSLDMGSLGNGWSMTIATSGSPATTFSNSAAILGGDTGKGRATPYASTINVSGLTGATTDERSR